MKQTKTSLICLGGTVVVLALTGCSSASSQAPKEDRKTQLEQHVNQIQSDPNRTAEQKAKDAEILRGLAAESKINAK